MAISVYEDLDALPNGVREALSFPSVPNFQRSLQWFRNLYDQALASTLTPRVYVDVGDDGVVSALFCGVPKQGARTLSSLTNFYSLEFGVSSAGSAGRRAEALQSIAAHIAQERFGRLDIRLLLDGDADSEALISAFSAAGYRCSRFFQFDNWVRRDTDAGGDDFDAYFDSLPSRLRNTVKRKGKRLERDYTVRVALEREPGDGLEQAISDYTRVYDQSWKDPEPYPGFMPGMIRAAASLGALTLGVLYLDDTPVAAQVWLHEPGRAVIYKLAYDEAYQKTSAGSVLSRILFEDTFERHDVGIIDYGVGSEAYKRDWMTEKRQIVGVVGFHPGTLRGRTGLVAERARRLVKRAIGRASDQ